MIGFLNLLKPGRPDAATPSLVGRSILGAMLNLCKIILTARLHGNKGIGRFHRAWLAQAREGHDAGDETKQTNQSMSQQIQAMRK
jgi:hypothetical protein